MTGMETKVVDAETLKKDSMTICSDIPVDRNEWLRDLTDDELWKLYNKYNEHYDNPDDPMDDVDDINDRISHKGSLIVEMNRRGLFNNPDSRERHVQPGTSTPTSLA